MENSFIEKEKLFMEKMVAKLDKKLGVAFCALTYAQQKAFCNSLIEISDMIKSELTKN